MVIFNHAAAACGDPSYLLKDTLTILRMPLYFLLSGLFFKRYGGFADFFIKKVNKLIIPFLFFHVLSCFVYPWLNKTTFEWHTLWDFFWHEGWLPNGPLWFLLCLFWQNIIFYGLFIISDRIGRFRIVFFSIILLVKHLPLIQRLMPRLFRLENPIWWVSALIGTVIVSLLYYAIIPFCRRFLPYVTAQKELLKSTIINRH